MYLENKKYIIETGTDHSRKSIRKVKPFNWQGIESTECDIDNRKRMLYLTGKIDYRRSFSLKYW